MPRTSNCFLILKDNLEALICQHRSYLYLSIMKSSHSLFFSRINIFRQLILLLNTSHILCSLLNLLCSVSLLIRKVKSRTKILYLVKVLSTLINMNWNQVKFYGEMLTALLLKKLGKTKTPSIKHCSGHSRKYGENYDMYNPERQKIIYIWCDCYSSKCLRNYENQEKEFIRWSVKKIYLCKHQ